MREVPDLVDARTELGPADERALTVERVDAGWVSAVAAVPDAVLDALAGRWIDRLEEEFGDLPREEKPMIASWPAASWRSAGLPTGRPTSSSCGSCDLSERKDLEASFASNQRLWDAWTKVHAEGEFYDVAGFREGRARPAV